MKISYKNLWSIEFFTTFRCKLISWFFLRGNLYSLNWLLNKFAFDWMFSMIHVLFWHLYFMMLLKNCHINSRTFIILASFNWISFAVSFISFFNLVFYLSLLLWFICLVAFCLFFFFRFDVEDSFKEINCSVFKIFKKLIDVVLIWLRHIFSSSGME